VLFYSLSRTGTKPPKTIVRCHATTDAEYDILYTLPNPDRPSVFLPEPYHDDVPQELVLSLEIEQNLCDDLRQLNRARFQRNFNPASYAHLVQRIRFRFPLCPNALLQHAARQALRSCPLNFFPDIGLLRQYERGTPMPTDPGDVLFDPSTGEVYD
jgi:hypothetical protein